VVGSVSILKRPSYSSSSTLQKSLLRHSKPKPKTFHSAVPPKPLVFKHYQPPVKRYKRTPAFKRPAFNPAAIGNVVKAQNMTKSAVSKALKKKGMKNVTPAKWHKRKPEKWRKYTPQLARTLKARNSKAAEKVPSSLNEFRKPKSFYHQRKIHHLLALTKRLKRKREVLFKKAKNKIWETAWLTQTEPKPGAPNRSRASRRNGSTT